MESSDLVVRGNSRPQRADLKVGLRATGAYPRQVTSEDYEQLRAVSPLVRDLPNVAVLSPRHGPIVSRIRKSELSLFPKATALSRRQWNLDEPGTRDFDLLIAANVFMYSRRPRQWFENALSRCAYLLLLELVRRRRGADGEFGPDGDCMRYAIGDQRPRVADFFDLGALDGGVVGWRTFYGGANEYDDSPLHVLALVRGSRRSADPRIDGAVGDVIALLDRE
jgi:hypothetical protein